MLITGRLGLWSRACVAIAGVAAMCGLAVTPARAAGPGSWTQLDNPLHPSARTYVATAYDPDVDATVVFGGSSYSSGGLLNETWLRHHDGSWTRVGGSQPGPRQLALAAYDPAAQRVILFGGAGPPPPGGSLLSRLGDTWAFDGSRWTQLHPAVAPPARFLAAMTCARPRA